MLLHFLFNLPSYISGGCVSTAVVALDREVVQSAATDDNDDLTLHIIFINPCGRYNYNIVA